MGKYLVRNQQERELVIDELRALQLDKGYSITISKMHQKRSTGQNSVYWVWLTVLTMYTGIDKLTLHNLFKHMFLPEDDFHELISTTNLHTGAFGIYLMQIHAYMSDFGITLMYPDEPGWEEFMKYYQLSPDEDDVEKAEAI